MPTPHPTGHRRVREDPRTGRHSLGVQKATPQPLVFGLLGAFYPREGGGERVGVSACRRRGVEWWSDGGRGMKEGFGEEWVLEWWS
jgi:hypothetical protein